MDNVKIKGIERAYAKKGVITDPIKQIYKINEEEFVVQNHINTLGNKIWRLKNEKLKLCQEKAKLEQEKINLFKKLGKKYIKPEGVKE